VAEDGLGQGLHVVGQDVVATVEQGVRARGVAHLLDGTGARTDGELGMIAGRPRQLHDVAADRVLEADGRDLASELAEQGGVRDRGVRSTRSAGP